MFAGTVVDDDPLPLSPKAALALEQINFLREGFNLAAL